MTELQPQASGIAGGARERRLKHELRTVAQLRTLVAQQPSKILATQLIGALDGMRSARGPAVTTLLDESKELAFTYLRESSRESWRRPEPRIWHECVEKVRQAAGLMESMIERDLSTPPTPPPPHRQARGQWDHDYDPYQWQSCWHGSISLRYAAVPPAVVVRSVEKAFKAAGLKRAYVTHTGDRVDAIWPPDEHEKWERDLVVAALESAAAAVHLPNSVVSVKWRKGEDW